IRLQLLKSQSMDRRSEEWVSSPRRQEASPSSHSKRSDHDRDARLRKFAVPTQTAAQNHAVNPPRAPPQASRDTAPPTAHQAQARAFRYVFHPQRQEFFEMATPGPEQLRKQL